ncbi:MAG: YjjG family noncanonical pyrimidine nucleotidase [Oscillospiraceae bacterium]
MAYYNCLLIDTDDTLLDFDASMVCAFSETMQHFNLPDTDEVLEIYRNINNELWEALEKGEIQQNKLFTQRFLKLLNHLNVKGDSTKMNAYYLERLATHSDMIAGADEMLTELAEVATIAIVSNGVDKVQRERLKLAGLDVFVDDIFTSEAVGATKPSRKIFDAALNSLGVTNREKVLVIGDSLSSDIKGGANAGLDTCWCNFKDIQNDTQIKPTHTVHGYEELLRVVMEEEELNNVGNTEKRHKL